MLPPVVVPVPPEAIPSAEDKDTEAAEMAPLEVMMPVLREVEKRLVELAVVEKKLVEVAEEEVELTAVKFCKVEEAVERRPLKELLPEKVLLLASKVEEAAVIVMSEEPLKEVPLMLRAVWRVVAVPALPPMLREEVATSRRLAPVGSE